MMGEPLRMIKQLAVLVAVFASSGAVAQQAVILGPDLDPVGVTLRSFSADKVEAIDWQGKALSLKTSEVLRVTYATLPEAWSDAASVKATLRDGQVLVGTLVESGDEESLRLSLSVGPEVEVSLDDLLSLAMDRDAQTPAVQEDDVILLATGETLIGFVETITHESVGFVVGDADDPIDIPLERVRALSVANKPEPADTSKDLVRVWLADDTAVLLQETSLDKDQQTLNGSPVLEIKPGKLSLPMDRVVRIEPMLGRYALSAMSSAPMKLLAGGEVFGVKMPPRVASDGSIRLHAPTTAGFELPKGATRLAFTAELALDDPDLPPKRRAMAGCELVVYEGDAVIGQCKLEHDKAPTRLNLAVSGTDLRIEVRPGVNGPVLDRVRISAAEVLITRR